MMQIFRKSVLLLTLLTVILSGSACKNVAQINDCIEPPNQRNISNINITFSTDETVPKATKIRTSLSGIKNAVLESFSAGEGYASMHFYIPASNKNDIYRIIGDDKDVTNISENKNSYECSNDDVKRYYAFKALTDNLAEVEKLLNSKTDKPVELNLIRPTLEGSVNNYKSMMERYKMQQDKINLYINFSRKPKKIMVQPNQITD